MKWVNKIVLLTPAILAICLFGAMKVMSSCDRAPVAMPFDASVIESVMNQPRPATLAPGDPEPPRVFLDTTYITPAGRTINVAAGGDVQAAIDQAQPGDVIMLQAGATFTGNFLLPNKSGSDWIVIRSSAADADLPPPGTRITPAESAIMPKLISPNYVPAAYTDVGAHHYRFIGVEFGVAEGKDIYNIVSFGADQTSLAQTPHDLIIDRCYIHGNDAGAVSRGVLLNCARAAVIDSYISNCHSEGFDSQAICGWNGSGPFKIVNNYLEGAGENVMFGGAKPSIQNLIASDVEFRLNHVYKPLSWKQGHPTYAGRPWTIKNLFELKNAQRLFIDRNIFENNWADAQNGFAILFTPRGEDGVAPWATAQDVTFTNNIVRHSGGGFNIAGPDHGSLSQPSQRILIRNNLIDDIDGDKWGSAAYGPADGKFAQIVGGPVNITIDHNTIFHSGSIIVADGAPSPGFIFCDNIARNNVYGVLGSDRSPGLDSLGFYFPGYEFRKNVIVGVPLDIKYPADNFLPLLLGLVGFVDLSGGDYRLARTSPYRNAGTDGKDVGCDIDALNGKINQAAMLSAASYRGQTLAVESIVAAFGTGLATSALPAFAAPLPTTLVGTTVKVKDIAGVERLSPLFYVSPTQVNFQIPPGTAFGAATVSITSGNGTVSAGSAQISAVAPGLFTVDASGRGLPAAVAVRVSSGLPQQFDSIARFDATQNKWLAVPIDLGTASDQIYLVLFGTGIRFRGSPKAVRATIGGVDAPVSYAGSQDFYVGLDQVNLLLPRTLIGRGDVDIVLIVDGQPANTVVVNVR